MKPCISEAVSSDIEK